MGWDSADASALDLEPGASAFNRDPHRMSDASGAQALVSWTAAPAAAGVFVLAPGCP